MIAKYDTSIPKYMGHQSLYLLRSIFDKYPQLKGGSVLQIGARPGGGWNLMFEFFKEIEYHCFDVLEIFEKNFERLNSNLLCHKYLGDIREIDKVIQNKYDTIIYWHGPEHIMKDEFREVLPKVMSLCNAFIIGCPHGIYETPKWSKQFKRNKYEKHVSHWYPEEFEELGFEVHAMYPPDKKKFIVAVKMEENR